MKSDIITIRQQLSHKALLTINECRLYLGLSQREFDTLEKNDPTFPKRKTPKHHSRYLIEEWLRINSPDHALDKHPYQLSPYPIQFFISTFQLN